MSLRMLEMASKTSIITPTKSSFLFLLLTLFLHSTSSKPLHHPKETKMTLYFHDFLTGPKATFVRVAGIPGNRWSFDNFGTVYVNDDIVTESLNPKSPIIARGQGMYSVSSLDASNAYTSLSVVFINKAYKGSTLEIQGRFAQSENVSELSVVSGTGKFRFARGYAIFTTITFNSTDLIARCELTLPFE